MTGTASEEVGHDLDRRGAFPILTEEQQATLAAVGRTRDYADGEVLFSPGDQSYALTVIVSGRVAVIDAYGTPDERTLVEHGAGRFLGELNLLTGQAVYLTAAAREPTTVIEVAVADLRGVLAEEPALSDILIRALLLRRAILLGSGVGVKVIGSRYSTDTGRLVQFLARSRVPTQWLDLEVDGAAELLLVSGGLTPADTPVVLTSGSRLLRNPSNTELAAAIGLSGPPETESDGTVDLLIVGSGPGGLAAAVYGASEGLGTLAVDAVTAGGQAGTSSRIENYLGFPAGLSGSDLAARALVQAEKFGARLTSPCEAAAITADGPLHRVRLTSGDEIAARAVVLATGARYRRLDVDRLVEFEGTDVFYAATQAEARRVADRPVVVIGGGNSAGQAAMFLAARTERVHLLIRRGDLAETMSRYLIDQIGREPRIELHPRTELVGLEGDDRLAGVRVAGPGGTDERRLDAAGVFVFIGAAAQTSGWATTWRPTAPGSCSPAAPTGRRWRPPARACSPSATSAPARSSGSPRPSARAPRWSRWCTPT